VPSGNAELPPPVPEAVALALTRLAVQTPDARARGRSTIDFCLVLSRWVICAFRCGIHRCG
jgi:hypothetical protein